MLMTLRPVLTYTIKAASVFAAGDLISPAGGKITADDQPVLGVAMNPATEVGQDIAIMLIGTVRLKATGAVTVGAKLVSSSGGGVEVAGGTPSNVFATALTAAADGGFTEILIR
ncbi:capsid cement protein [Oceaniglobus trochenteri]|uniref:capsid cement protein n=1 Tax=Oceaniglobus trochenteri TaxID=2763260 RepID=UPI001CFF9C16|nr:capsid cement protein [Oceaniglobus trochenteri]